MKTHFVLLLLLLLPGHFCFSQKLNFDIYLFGNLIGQSVVEKNVVHDSISTYSLTSSSEARIFFTLRKNYLHYEVVYQRDHLQSSHSKNVRNADVFTTDVTKSSDAYIVKKETGSYCTKPVITCSSVKLFFNEPCGVSEIFSERLGSFRPIKQTGTGEYEVDMGDGIIYIYRYMSGKLIELEMKKNFLGSIYVRTANR